ncbi:hypothetical protein LCGC14_2926150, partial [marine sediment metagenome]
AWACRRWGQHEHDWLTCYSCQRVYEVHVQEENNPDQGGVLHWTRENKPACGALTEAMIPDLMGAHTPVDVVIAGVLRINPKVSCPLCLEFAEGEGHQVKIPEHKTPFQHG